MVPTVQARQRHGHVNYVDQGQGPALLLIHGIGGNWQNWLGTINGLASQHRVIALDLPGFGRSEPLTSGLGVPQYADALIELLDLLAIERATLVGNSMGGALTIEAAARHPDRVAAAVLACSAGIPLTGWRHKAVTIPLGLAVNLTLRHTRVRHAVIGRPRLRRAIASRIVHDARATDQRLLAEALNGLGSASFSAVLRAGAGYDLRPQARRMQCPTLVLWGARDRLLPLPMGEELHRLIDRSQLVVWDDSGHAPMIEHPERFQVLVSEFVAAKVVGRGSRPNAAATG